MTFWLFAPSVSNLSGSWQKAVVDFTNPITYARKTSIKEDQSWESWWHEEQVHLKIYRCQWWRTHAVDSGAGAARHGLDSGADK
ncbi:hypothetical protein EJ110_NYTH58230 [Nymphaea thermarum]|nr:hypothetical protein EJ110_NYTH58230 [Nymphaea thermarum]